MQGRDPFHIMLQLNFAMIVTITSISNATSPNAPNNATSPNCNPNATPPNARRFPNNATYPTARRFPNDATPPNATSPTATKNARSFPTNARSFPRTNNHGSSRWWTCRLDKRRSWYSKGSVFEYEIDF